MDPENTQTIQPIQPVTPVQPVPVQPASVPPIPQQKSKLPLILGIIVLLGIVGLLGILGGKYLFGQKTETVQPVVTVTTPTPTVDPTINWKTYTNKKVGFEIKYPSRYQNIMLPTGPSESERFASGEEQNGILIFGKSPDDSFHLEFTPYKGTLPDLIKEKETPSTSEKVLIRRTTTAGTIAEWYISAPPIIYPDHSETGFLQIFFVQNNYGFFLNSRRSNSEMEMSQILSTFKFTDEKNLGEKVSCKNPRPEVCTMECVAQPPYICGSNGKSYCSSCQACANSEVEWHIVSNKPCGD